MAFSAKSKKKSSNNQAFFLARTVNFGKLFWTFLNMMELRTRVMRCSWYDNFLWWQDRFEIACKGSSDEIHQNFQIEIFSLSWIFTKFHSRLMTAPPYKWGQCEILYQFVVITLQNSRAQIPWHVLSFEEFSHSRTSHESSIWRAMKSHCYVKSQLFNIKLRR